MATNDNIVEVRINVNPMEGKRNNRAAVRQEIEQTMLNMKNLIIDNVAFFIKRKQEAALTTNLNRVMATVVRKELTTMGRRINELAVGLKGNDAKQAFRFEGKNGRQSTTYLAGPKGTLSIDGPIARSMQGQTGPVSLVGATGPWPARSAKYLRWKKKKFGTDKWFRNTGTLSKALKNPDLYLGSYGPVKVSFKRAAKDAYLPTVVGVSPITSGEAGRPGRRVSVGTVSVGVLSRITTDMLNDPGGRQPSPWATGLFDYLPSEVENKLLNREDRYRPFLEHFLSYYLTRAIPNAVFRKLEQTVKYVTANQIDR